MYIDISILTRLQFVAVHKEFPVEFLVQLIKNQPPLGRHQRAVRIRITFVPNITNCLALRIHIIHHMNEIQLIISIIPVAFCHRWIHPFQRSLHNVMHILDGNFFFPQRFRLLSGKTTDKFFFFFRKFIENTGCGFIDSRHYFLSVKFFSGSVFLDDVNHNCSFQTQYIDFS